ncbi:hypothetical protein [Methylocella silvestris]|uniref:hypothetical protein n=1 Tax=Methylocella silvestris TaxID=199596 RepID=UPI001650BA7F|nr:hypothetical protein [Methylocella silvestris]
MTLNSWAILARERFKIAPTAHSLSLKRNDFSNQIKMISLRAVAAQIEPVSIA